VLQGVGVLLLAAAAPIGPAWPRLWLEPLRIGAAAVGFGGLWLMAGGARRLGRQLTPFPRPVEEGALQQGGVYRLVRHPIYGGVLLLSIAWSMLTSPLALVPAALLALLFAVKSRREEAWLVEAHPGYLDYRRRVRRRLIPFVW